MYLGYVFSTCANSGRRGPTQHQCDLVYQGHGDLHVKVVDDNQKLPAGTQLWTVPVDGHYTYVYTVLQKNTRSLTTLSRKMPHYSCA